MQDYNISSTWYLTRIAEELDTLHRMQVTEERLVNIDTVVLLQVIKRLNLHVEPNSSLVFTVIF